MTPNTTNHEKLNLMNCSTSTDGANVCLMGRYTDRLDSWIDPGVAEFIHRHLHKCWGDQLFDRELVINVMGSYGLLSNPVVVGIITGSPRRGMFVIDYRSAKVMVFAEHRWVSGRLGIKSYDPSVVSTYYKEGFSINRLRTLYGVHS